MTVYFTISTQQSYSLSCGDIDYVFFCLNQYNYFITICKFQFCILSTIGWIIHLFAISDNKKRTEMTIPQNSNIGFCGFGGQRRKGKTGKRRK